MKQNDRTIKNIVVVGLMAAVVFIFTYMHIDIPTPLGKTMLHLGNVMCLLAALLFGPVRGGLAAGFGSMFYDMFDPAYLPECWITFINKFAMAFVAGLVAHRLLKGAGRLRFPAAAALGALSYTALYVGKTIIVQYFVYNNLWETVWATAVTKGTVSLVNTLIAAVASVLLNAALRKAFTGAGLNERLGVRA